MKGLEYAISLMDKNFGTGMRKAQQSTKGMDNAVQSVNNHMGRMKGIGQNSMGSIISIAKKAAVAIGAVFALNSVIQFGNEVTKITAQFEGMTNAIEFASGKEGGQNLQFLDDTIKTLNLDMTASYKGFQTLSGAMKGTKLEGQGVRDIFKGVATAATVMNLTGEQAEGAFLALSQMASKGKVQAEELRGQLGERIPGALKIAAEAMGVSQMEFNNLLDAGKIYAEDFLPKFSRQLQLTFEGGLPKAADSMQAAINKKNNALLSFKRNFGEAFRPVITELLEIGSKFFGFLGDMLKHLEPVKVALKGVWNALEPLRTSLEKGMAPLKKFSEDGNAAKGVMEGLAKAIEFVTPAIELIGKILALLNDQIVKVRNMIYEKIQALNEAGTAGEFLGNVMTTLTYIWELLSPVVSAVGDVLVIVVDVIFQAAGAFMTLVNAMFEFGRKTEWIQRLLNSFKYIAERSFNHVKDVAKMALGSVGDLLIGIFTFDIDRIKSSLAKGFGTVHEITKAALDSTAGMAQAWNEELDKPINKEVNVTVKGKQKAPQSMIDYLSGLDGTKTPEGDTKTPSFDSGTGGSVSGSGTSTKHTTFNIQSFVKEMIIKVDSLKESPQDIKRQLNQVFQEWVADLELRADVN